MRNKQDFIIDIQADNDKQSRPSKITSAKSKRSCSLENPNLNMQVIGGFMMVLGAAALAIAFTLLNVSTLGIGLGVAALVVGLGIFAEGTCGGRKSHEATKDFPAILPSYF